MDAKRQELLIVTGMSGAGRSTAANALEDLGWYVVDNLPPQMLGPIADLLTHTKSPLRKLAVVIDVRGGEFFGELNEHLQQQGFVNHWEPRIHRRIKRLEDEGWIERHVAIVSRDRLRQAGLTGLHAVIEVTLDMGSSGIQRLWAGGTAVVLTLTVIYSQLADHPAMAGALRGRVSSLRRVKIS